MDESENLSPPGEVGDLPIDGGEGEDGGRAGDDRIWPYKNEQQVRKAAEAFGHRATKQFQRAQIIARLKKSGPLAAQAVPQLLLSFSRQDMNSRHELITALEDFIGQGADLTESADELGKHLNEPNFALRERIGQVLIKMGPTAAGSLTRVMGCTRHGAREVRLLSVKVLAAIGPAAGTVALKRLEGMRKGAESDTEMMTAISAALDAIGTGEPAAHAAHQSGLHPAPPLPADGEKPAEPAAEESPTVVMRLVETLAAPNLPGEQMNKTMAVLTRLPEKLRLEGLARGLASQNQQIRRLAAKLMQNEFAHAVPFAKEINQAFLKETDLITRGHIADLLTCILLQLSFKG